MIVEHLACTGLDGAPGCKSWVRLRNSCIRRLISGPLAFSRIVAVPDAVKYFPRSAQDAFRKRALRPAGARWLVDRFTDIAVSKARFVESVAPSGSRLSMRLNDGSLREVDHVLLGTGYRVDVSRYPFLSSELIQGLSQINGFPKLKPGFESSIRGLHFLGAPSAWDFGPLMFFVCGTDYAARRLARFIAAPESRKGSSVTSVAAM